jgi:predicted kinase
MAKVIILCGKIASGKSYYANSLRNRTKAVILSVDELMLRLSNNCLGSRHDDVASRCENYFYSLAEQIVGSGLDVIIDFGYWSKAEREQAKAYFNMRRIGVELHYINIPEKKRLEQLSQRNNMLQSIEQGNHGERVYLIGEELRQRLDSKFEEPTNLEYDKMISNI